MKMESKIHNVGFLISPITHLFPLAGQSGSHGVSSMINFEIKVCNSEKLYQSIQSCMSVLNQSKKKGKRKKVKWTQIPLGGMGSELKRAYSKKILFYYYWLQYQKTEISETSWSFYGMKPRSYNSPKFLNFTEREDPWGDLNAPEPTFEQKIHFLSVKPDKKQQE